MDSSVIVAPRSYQDFIPKSEWIREEGADKLILELPGFRMENLKVQLDNSGNLRTSGERALGGNVSSRFRKEFRVPENCNTGQIRAKFENGILTIILPKFTSEAEPVPAPVTQAPQPQASIPKPSMPEPETDSATIEKGKAVTEKTEATEKVKEVVKEKRKYGVEGLGMQMKTRPLLINIIIAVLVLVGVGSYVAYKFRQMAEAEARETLDFDEL